jgi:hypothetical protein
MQEEMGKMPESEVVVGLRLPREIVKEADALLPKLKRAEFRAVGRVSRSLVLRLAIIRGLQELRKEYR